MVWINDCWKLDVICFGVNAVNLHEQSNEHIEIIAGSCVNGGEYLRHDGPSVAPLKWIMSECVGAARLP